MAVWAAFGTENSHCLFYCLMMNTCKDQGGGGLVGTGGGGGRGGSRADKRLPSEKQGGREEDRPAGNTPACVSVCGSQVTFLQTCCTCSLHATAPKALTHTYLNWIVALATYSIRFWDLGYKQGRYD